MAEQRVTIRDIAKIAGLHFTTVSLALRNSPRLNDATRSKIQKLAKKMGYRPDPMLASLNAYRQSKSQPHYQATIAWINNWPERYHMLSNAEFLEYYQGAKERSEERGYVLEEFWLREPGMNVEKINRIFKARNIQGMLIAPQPESQTILPFDYEELSTVALGYSMRPASLHVVTNHHFHSMNLIFTRLRDLGYKRAGLCVGLNWDEKVENGMLGGWELWNWKNPNQIEISHFTDAFKNNRERVEKWIKKEKPEVIVATDDSAELLMSWGYKFPGDMGYASLALKHDEKYFSGIYQNDILIGKKAIDLVIGMIQRGERGLPETPIRTLIESEWHSGKTLRQQKVSSMD
ncbi:MAG: LacI family DNA-binding transcriptional regulator [Methylacidiphilales bacterium]|nr:LacI family DNA-binding transcriptional regulator [Candidatus Methylacidiphilales bacterium]